MDIFSTSRTSGFQAIEHSRKRNRLANVFETADPGDCAFDAHAEAACGTEPYFRRSRYHSKASRGSSCSLSPLHQKVVARHALAAANDFAVAFRRKNVHAQRNFGTQRIRFHVEGLDRGGITVNHHGLVELSRNDGFVAAAEVAAPWISEPFFCRILTASS